MTDTKDTADVEKDSSMQHENDTKDEDEKADIKDSPAKLKEDSDKEDQANGSEHEDKSEDEEDEEEDEEEEEKEELPPGLLERPLEVEGKREKKKVERLSAAMIRSPTEKPQMEIKEGRGTKLGDIPYVSHFINVTKAVDLKPLHRVLFLRFGAVHDIKKNIRKFSGFTEEKDSKEREKRKEIANKLSVPEVKSCCTWMGVKSTGTKSDLVDKLLEYLEKPDDQGIEPKKKRSRSKTPAKKGTKRKRKDKPEKKKTTKKSKKAKKEEDAEEDGEDNDEEQDSIEDKDSDDDEEESEDEAPKKKAKIEVKKKKTPQKKPKKTVKENGKKEKAAAKKPKSPPKKEVKKKSPTKKPVVELSDLSGDESDSDEEPLAKSAKPPSDDEIKKTVKGLLEGADLETVTMKTVVKQVYAKYPKFDLSERKDFIKSTVREVIS